MKRGRWFAHQCQKAAAERSEAGDQRVNACKPIPGFAPLSRGFRLGVVLCLGLVCASAAEAQMLIGPWVDEAARAVERHRKTDVRLIVLDAEGAVVEGAEVRVEQLSHRVMLGLDGDDATLAKAAASGLPFDTIALPPPWGGGERGEGPLKQSGPPRRLAGPLIPADLADWPGGLVRADDAALREALLSRLDAAAATADRLLVFGDLIGDGNAALRRLGPGFVRRAMQRLRARRPRALIGWDAGEALMGGGQAAMLREAVAMRERFVPFDFVAASYRSSSPMPAKRMAVELRRLDALNVPVLITAIQTGGENPIEAATHAETLLRLLFARPEVEGLLFAALTPDNATEPHAALIDDAGELTAVGRVVARLFGETWRSQPTGTTDAAGNLYTRLFHGTYRITATLPDGVTAEAEVRIDPAPARRIVAIQPLK